jgi:ubiquinone/menaquinone biosynthesis C-methylase UbiE
LNILNRLYLKKIADLGALRQDPRLCGIWVSEDFDGAVVDRYIHQAFRENAADYAERYQNVAHHEAVLRDALEKAGWGKNYLEPLIILDIGSGAGNTVIPLLNILPHAQVIASDLSLELLLILKNSLSHSPAASRVTYLQLNAEDLQFRAGSLDLVIGSAILHHLFAPEKTLRGCAEILRAGGCAMFFEPFEPGNMVLRVIWERILQDPRAAEIAPDVRGFFRALINEYEARKGRDKSAPRYAQMEDKWLFTRQYFEEQRRVAGFSNLMIYSLISPERLFEAKTEVCLKLGIDKEKTGFPEWAWRLVREYEQYFTLDGRADLLIEAGIILQK